MRKRISLSQLRQVGNAFRQARVTKRLTQSDLGARVGLPQSHISKIESGAVDLQLSSLSEIARALDLELKLVPRAALPVVDGLLRTLVHDSAGNSSSTARATLEPLVRLARDIAANHPDLEGLVRFRQTLDELGVLSFHPESLRALQDAAAPATKLARLLGKDNQRKLHTALAKATNALVAVRNAYANGDAAPRQLPAHSLVDDEDD